MLPSTHLPFQTNRLLAALPADEYQRILPSLEALSLQPRASLYEPNETIEYVYFPLSGMASILISLGDGKMSEAGIAGNEGMVGLPLFLGAEKTHTKSFYQVAGDAARMRRDDFKAEIQRHGALVSLLQRYVLAYFAMLAQNSACNSQHRISQRCARWMLLTHDRVGVNRFELTQELISEMLGVRRAGVNAVMQNLQEMGVIHYSRGIITIIDRTKLEQAACECYSIITDEYKRAMSG